MPSKKTPLEAINWNRLEDDYALTFWQQNLRQFWIDEEIPLSADRKSWNSLNKDEKEVYKQVLAGLTLLDSKQASCGMPQIALATESGHHKAILSFMGFMEHMHTKSYSSIFSTLCNEKEIDTLFDWIKTDNPLQDKLELILHKYNNIKNNESFFMAMAASVFLESFLFYSSFFYPLLLAGNGKMINSGEIINLIIRDESIHGVYTGLLAQDLLSKLPPKTQIFLKYEVLNLAEQLLKIEEMYCHNIYNSINLEREVNVFTKYNCNKALMNLGFEPMFNINDEDISPIVLRGLDTKTKNHDFFSTKGNGYIKTLKVETIEDDDFNV